MDPLVANEWLEQHLNDPHLVVLDCSVHTDQNENGVTNVSGRADYEVGYIPTAGFADLTNELCDKESELEFDLPTSGAFCAAMGRLEVGDQSTVALYDNSF